MKQIIRLAWSYLKYYKKQTMALFLGIVLSCALFTGIGSLQKSGNHAARENARTKSGDSEEPGAHLGIEKGVLLETVIPEFFAALGKRISAADSTFDVWYPTHTEEFDTLAAEYAEKTQ